tara:strand:+ start:6632 stop:7045 length:414 start_codon:yes stop_codon:yes gene_type:complete
MIVELVPTNTIHIIWGQIENYLKEAVKKSAGEYGIEHLKAGVVAGLQSLYVVIDESTNEIKGGIIVNFINYPNFRVAHITAIGGKSIVDEDTWKNLAFLLKQAGATKCQACAIESTTRLYKSKVGFKKVYNVVERIL